jgi:hypothetical protein
VSNFQTSPLPLVQQLQLLSERPRALVACLRTASGLPSVVPVSALQTLISDQRRFVSDRTAIDKGGTDNPPSFIEPVLQVGAITN